MNVNLTALKIKQIYKKIYKSIKKMNLCQPPLIKNNMHNENIISTDRT